MIRSFPESNKFVLINFLETDLIDEELFTLTFTEVAEQVKAFKILKIIKKKLMASNPTD